MWTIDYNGTEKSLEDWGLSNLRRRRMNMGIDTVTFLADGRAVDAADLFSYGSTVIVYRDRTKPGSGGKRWFYGRIAPWNRAGTHNAERHLGMCAGPWWYLQERVFRQSVKAWAGWSTPGDPTSGALFETKTFNHIWLNQKITGEKQNWREQVIEALQWSISCGDPIAIGTITPAFDVPVDEVKNITCADVLRQMYRWCLDATFWWDYSTLPYPTLHCKRLSELTGVIIDLNAGDLIEEIQIKERPDWKRPYVLLQFEQVNNGVLDVIEDKWPDPLPSGPPPGGLETTIDLKGWTINALTQRVETAAFDPTNINWWKTKVGWLNAEQITSIEILGGADAPTLTGRDGFPWNPIFVRELVPGRGAIADWMVGVGAQQVRAEAAVKVTFLNGSVKTREKLVHDFVVTNAVTQTYSKLEVTEVGDPVPVGLAKEMWTGLQALGCQGSVTLTDEECPEDVDFGKKLNFVTPARPEWASLNAMIQEIEDDALQGSTTITFGAPDALSAAELVELLRVARNRFNPTPFSLRTTGLASSTSAQLPDRAGEGNSTVGGGNYSTHVVSSDPEGGEQWQVQTFSKGEHDRPRILIVRVNSGGGVVSGQAKMDLDLGDLTGTKKELKLRETRICEDGVERRCWVLRTESEDL